MRVCRKRMDPPSSRTMRSPVASFPSDRPRVSVSTVTGTMTTENTTLLRISACMAASSRSRDAAVMRMIRSIARTTWEMTSIMRPRARAAKDAGRSSRTTASPVMIELMPAPKFCQYCGRFERLHHRV